MSLREGQFLFESQWLNFKQDTAPVLQYGDCAESGSLLQALDHRESPSQLHSELEIWAYSALGSNISVSDNYNATN